MGDKTDATWHPNSGPGGDHTDLIARLRAIVDVTEDEYTDIDQAANVIQNLGDSVPRALYTHAVAVHEEDGAAVASAERERDEARAAITGALAILGDRIPLGASVVRALDRRLADVRDALTSTPSMSVALHDAEVKAQALDEAAVEARRRWEPYSCPWVGFLDDRAAAIRAEANG